MNGERWVRIEPGSYMLTSLRRGPVAWVQRVHPDLNAWTYGRGSQPTIYASESDGIESTMKAAKLAVEDIL